MSKIPIVINGPPRAGKDTVVDMARRLAAKFGVRVVNISSVDTIKQAAVLLGWDGVKNARGRRFLSDLKDLSTRHYDGPLRYMINALDRIEGDTLVFFHIREPDEILKFTRETGARTLLIMRTEVEQFDNHADQGWRQYGYQEIIHNDGSLEDLFAEVSRYVMGVLAGGRSRIDPEKEKEAQRVGQATGVLAPGRPYLSVERDCCGTIVGSPHRSGCENYKGKRTTVVCEGPLDDWTHCEKCGSTKYEYGDGLGTRCHNCKVAM